MNPEQELANVIKLYRENLELEAKIENIQAKIEQNHKLIIKYFSPYLLSIYEKWRPRMGEKAMAIDFDAHICFEVIIDKIDGYRIRAREGEKSNVYHRFELNPALEEYEVPNFIIPKSCYDEIKDFFDFEYLE